jgi:hypothetical protein
MKINSIMNSKFGKILLQLLIFSIILYFIQNFILNTYFKSFEFYIATWKIYLFHFLTVSALIFFLIHRSKIKPDRIFNAFVILSVIKMVAAIIFLMPLFITKGINLTATIFSFFIPYFLFLFLESSFTLKLFSK